MRSRLQDGTATVEMAIMAPIFAILLLWSISFSDILVVKLAAQEAARFAAWQATVDVLPISGADPGGGAIKDIQTRFADLRSPETMNYPHTGLLSFPSAIAAHDISVAVNDQMPASLAPGQVPPPNTGGFIGSILRFLNGLGNAIMGSMNWLLGHWGFNMNGATRTTVTLTVPQKLLPLRGGKILTGDFRNIGLPATLSFRETDELVYDTWKAWPNPLRTRGDNPATPPKQSYPVAEQYVATTMNNMAFFGILRNPVVNAIRRGLGLVGHFFGFPPILDTSARSRHPADPTQAGPVTMMPSCGTGNSGVVNCSPPSHQMASEPNSQRIGNAYSYRLQGNPQNGLQWRSLADPRGGPDGAGAADRSRYSLPYKVQSRYWMGFGAFAGGGPSAGGGTAALAMPDRRIYDDNSNPYALTWRCRGYFYMGDKVAQCDQAHPSPACYHASGGYCR